MLCCCGAHEAALDTVVCSMSVQSDAAAWHAASAWLFCLRNADTNAFEVLFCWTNTCWCQVSSVLSCVRTNRLCQHDVASVRVSWHVCEIKCVCDRSKKASQLQLNRIGVCILRVVCVYLFALCCVVCVLIGYVRAGEQKVKPHKGGCAKTEVCAPQPDVAC
jgi:hypothetical protein